MGSGNLAGVPAREQVQKRSISSETLDEAAVMDEEPPKLVFGGPDRVERTKVLGLHFPRRQKVLDLEDGDHF